MKAFRCLFFLVFLGNSAFSQEIIQAQPKKNPLNYRNEIGINLIGFTDLMHVHSLVNFLAPENVYYLNSIIYKRHYNKNIFRSCFSYQQKTYNIDIINDGHPVFVIHDFEKYGEIRLGYERIIKTGKKFSLSAAIDGVYGIRNSKGSYFFSNDLVPPYYNKGTYNVNDQFAGMAYSLGLRYKISHHFSISAEASITHLKMISRHDPINPSNYTPLRLMTLNYHFGKK